MIFMTHIAIDIGASSGRLVHGDLNDGKLSMQEIHRFSNSFALTGGQAQWNVDKLLIEILKGLEKVKKLGYENITIGIDTWAVDYVLIDQHGERIQEAFCYRDQRTENAMEKMGEHISMQAIYEKTGIQLQRFNTLFQLSVEEPALLEKAKYILLIPDYLAYRLTGRAVLERTNASTMQLFNVTEGVFDVELLSLIGVKAEQFAPFIDPGQVIGELQYEQFKAFDLPRCTVIAVASHDTASAIAGTPGVTENWAYLSSGTWSLLGVEKMAPIITPTAFRENYTNEWGVFGTYRFLINIMGMWILQEVLRNSNENYELEQVLQEAAEVEPYLQFINFNEIRFLKPSNMIIEIQRYCEETMQIVPQTIGELAACVFSNLSIIYAMAIEQLQYMTQASIDTLCIVGGGSKNHMLNQMTANMSKRTVFAGPAEATAIGNILLQLMAVNKVQSLQEGRQLVYHSFPVQVFEPVEASRTDIIARFKKITAKEQRLA